MFIIMNINILRTCPIFHIHLVANVCILQVVRHFLFIPRFQRMFQSYEKAKLMGSYMENRNRNTIRGLADAEAFLYLEEQYP